VPLKSGLGIIKGNCKWTPLHRSYTLLISVSLFSRCAVLLQNICLFVCLSLTRRYSVETTKHILKRLPSGSHAILVFLFRRAPNGGAECRGCKNSRFSYPSFRMVTVSMALSNLEWHSEIFKDTKHRAISLRQLSYL